jgi:pyridoxal phosphate enzyme (YggS family)
MNTTAMPSRLADRLAAVQETIAAACARADRDPATVTLVAMTKGFGSEVAEEALAAGLTDVGENYVQEAAAKLGSLRASAAPFRAHLCGHLQTNKVRDALASFAVFQTVDSVRLIEAIERQAPAGPIEVFLQVNLSDGGVDGRSGVAAGDLPALVERARASKALVLRGLMTVPPPTPTAEEARPVFRRLRELATHYRLEQLSMGMSDDYAVAIEEGATHIRLGRALFGERPR